MASSWQCPYCQHFASISRNDYDFFSERSTLTNKRGPLVFSTLVVACPNPKCRQITVTATIHQAKNPDANFGAADYKETGKLVQSWPLLPASKAKAWPAYVPQPIVADYNEACAIETLSPKASATISRRAVQQIIRDYWNVSKDRLYEEIQAIKSKLQPEIWEAVDALREVGNIGAHSEKDINVIVDVEPGEARALIRLVEILIEETYIARERRSQEIADVKEIADAKKALRKGTTPPALPGTSD